MENKDIKQIVALVKNKLVDISGDDMLNIMKSHYETLHLLDKDGKWVSKTFEDNSNYFLPKELDQVYIESFIDGIAKVNEKNTYLVKALNHILKYDYKNLKQKYDKEGHIVIPDIVGYSIVIELLTRACAKDYRLLEEIYYVFKEAREKTGAFKQLPLFHKIKMISVDLPIKKTYIRYHKERKIPPKSGGLAVKINILEATFTDFKSGNKGNSYTGKILAKYRCGHKKVDPATGAGPSGFSPDGKMIERAYPLGEKWAALYQSWNLAFVTRFRDFPYIMPKLLIPQVASFQQKPKEYIYNRAIALFIYLNFAGFDYIEKKLKKEEVIDWHSRELMINWGNVNKLLAKSYEADVKESKRVGKPVGERMVL